MYLKFILLFNFYQTIFPVHQKKVITWGYYRDLWSSGSSKRNGSLHQDYNIANISMSLKNVH